MGINHIKNVEVHEEAVSDKPGNLEFIRVLGNTTGSHLAGAKQNPYDQLERFEVRVETINTIISSLNFVKLYAGGQEKIIILGADASNWANTNMIVEIGSPENAQAIYNHLTPLGAHLFSQKLGRKKALTLNDVATSYKEVSMFLSSKPIMP